VAKAAETILEVIAGLEALAAAGVLHRDLKPANCFVANDGSIKVGDFGLSTPTRVESPIDLQPPDSMSDAASDTGTQRGHAGHSLITIHGSPRGTPAYASPEQWRGDPALDVRSDIYAVGATLCELLTGRVPDRPAAPDNWGQGIPRSLGRIIARCLSVERTGRYASYDKLRRVLVPFTSAALDPASVGQRFVAGLIDYVVTALLLFAMTQELYSPPLDALDALHRGGWPGLILLNTLLISLYFAVFEWWWSSTPGKAIFGLHVADRSGQRIKIARAAGRALLFVLPITVLPLFLIPALFPREHVLQATAGSFPTIFAASCAGFLLLFATMRKGNGFSALHDLLSGTRVFRRRHTHGLAEARAGETNRSQVGSLEGEKLGPYVLLRLLWQHEGESLWLGYDEVLRRKLWIHRLAKDASSLSQHRRAVDRPGRLRWLSGQRTALENWDAYEAFEGQPLAARSPAHEPWATVRLWLKDLAEEYEAGLKDGTLPSGLAPGHVWITNRNRAVMLDFACPGVENRQRPLAVPPSLDSMQGFLNAVAEIALVKVRAPLPPPVQVLLNKVRERAFDRADQLAENIRSLVSRPAFISRRQRLLSLVAWPCGVALITLLLLIPHAVLERLREAQLLKLSPNAPALKYLLEARVEFATTPNRDICKQLDLRFAGEFRDLIANEAFWALLPKWHLGIPRTIAESAVETFPSRRPTRCETRRAEPTFFWHSSASAAVRCISGGRGYRTRCFG
jgi:uncharacterized RDD family membrane protein YckC